MVFAAAAMLAACDVEQKMVEPSFNGTVTITESPFVNAFPNPCAPGTITLTGTVRVVYREHIDGNGGFHATNHVRTMDMRAVDATGGTYQAAGGFNGVVYFSSDQVIATEVSMFNLRSDLTNDGIVVQTVTHMTYANGEMRATVAHVNAQCTG